MYIATPVRCQLVHFMRVISRGPTFQPSSEPAKEVKSTSLISPHVVCVPHCQILLASCILLKDSFKSLLVQFAIHVVSTGTTAVSIRVDVVQIDGEEWMRYVTRVGVIRCAYRHGNSSPQTEGEMKSKFSEASIDVPRVDEAITVGVPEIAMSLECGTVVSPWNLASILPLQDLRLVSVDHLLTREFVVRFRNLVFGHRPLCSVRGAIDTS